MRLAAIDIGTNSIHMIVVEVKPDLSFEVVDREKEMVRLGSGGLEGGRLADATQAAALDTLERFRQLAESRQVDEIVAAATSAVREAQNGGEFLGKVIERTGIRVRVISGVEEARLVHLAAVYAVEAASGTTVVIDVGGGSTEITLGTAKEVHLARSFPLGVIRLTDRFVSGDPLPRSAERRLVKHVRKEAGAFLEQVRSSGFERVIATSGTNLSLGQVALNGRRLFDSERIHHSRLKAEALHRVRKQVVSLDMQGRLRLPGLDSRRADIIVSGAVLLDTVVGLLRADEVILCDLALREGLVLDYISRNGAQIERADRYPDIRRRSVVELGERCRWYPDHTRQVARLALSLFDQTRGLHGLGPREREWLEFAALLHDVGGHISYIGHDEHSVLPDSERRPPGVRARGGGGDRVDGALPSARAAQEIPPGIQGAGAPLPAGRQDRRRDPANGREPRPESRPAAGASRAAGGSGSLPAGAPRPRPRGTGSVGRAPPVGGDGEAAREAADDRERRRALRQTVR